MSWPENFAPPDGGGYGTVPECRAATSMTGRAAISKAAVEADRGLGLLRSTYCWSRKYRAPPLAGTVTTFWSPSTVTGSATGV